MEELQQQQRQFSFKDYVHILYRGKGIIFLCFLVVFSATVYYTFTALPIYEASAMVMIKEDTGVRRELFRMTSPLQMENRINNQVEILKSLTLAEDVIRELQKFSGADTLWILGKRKRPERFYSSWVQFVSRWGVFKKGVKKERKALPDTLNEELGILDLAEQFRKSISVVPKRNTDMIEVKVRAPSAFEAAFIANTWMEVYQKRDLEESRGEITEVLNFLEVKLDSVEKNLSLAEENLKNYKENQKVAELSSETEQLIRQLAEFETAYQEAKTELEANERRLEYLKSQLNENQKAFLAEAASVSSPVIQELQKQMANLIAEKAAYEQQLKGAGYYSTNDPKLKTLEQRLKGIEESIVEETRKLIMSGGAALNPLGFSETLFNNILQIETENKSLRAKTSELRKIVDQYNQMMNKLPEKSLKLARLMREAEVNNKIFMMLREKYEENRITEAGQIGSVRIVDRARPPKYPIKPKKKVNLVLGFMMGIGLGVSLVFLREYLDTSLKTAEDVEQIGFTVLGAIPFIPVHKIGRKLLKSNGEIIRIESRLITHFAPKSPISEAYRTIRTNIQYANPDHPVKTVVVTSSGMGEGKSTSVANLAITFAQMGSKTLLVDTDLRRPVLHGIFEQSRNEGLTNLLVGRLSFDEAIKPTRVENLFLLTSGTLPPNPSELLASKMMEKFIEEVQSKFDIVLFDTPPVIAVTDACVLAPKTNGVILVVRSGTTGREALFRSRMLLENVKANIFGVLVNGLHVDRLMGSSYYYYYYYYSTDGKEERV